MWLESEIIPGLKNMASTSSSSWGSKKGGISRLENKLAKSAVAVGTLAFVGAFFPCYTVNDETVSMVLKLLASLLSPTAFALGSVNFADYERACWTPLEQHLAGIFWSVLSNFLPAPVHP